MSPASLVKSVAREIADASLFEKSASVVVAVSGGRDSMALLHALHELNTKFDFQLSLHAAHLNHRLRGSEAEEDAVFVQAASAELSIPCTIVEVRLPYPAYAAVAFSAKMTENY